MPHIGQIVPYFNGQGVEKAAVIIEMHKDGTFDLAVLTANTRRVPGRTWAEPGTCMVAPEVSGESAPGTAIEVDLSPQELAAAATDEILESARRVDAAREATDGSAQE